MPFVYILECSDASYYVGSTWDLERRVGEHDLGLGAEYTRRRRPVRLVWSCQLNRVDEAFRVEKQIQGWSRAKRQALIEGRFEDLPALARTAKPRDSRGRSTDGGVVSTGSTDETPGGVVSTSSTDETPGSTDETPGSTDGGVVSTSSTDGSGGSTEDAAGGVVSTGSTDVAGSTDDSGGSTDVPTGLTDDGVRRSRGR